MGTKGSKRDTKETKNTCDLSGKLHKRGMIAVPTLIIQPWRIRWIRKKQQRPSGASVRPPSRMWISASLRFRRGPALDFSERIALFSDR